MFNFQSDNNKYSGFGNFGLPLFHSDISHGIIGMSYFVNNMTNQSIQV